MLHFGPSALREFAVGPEALARSDSPNEKPLAIHGQGASVRFDDHF